MSRTRDLVANGATAVLVLCAVVITATVLRREFAGGGSGASSAALLSVRGAEVSAATGHPLGPPDAPVRMVVFSDFQCPFCAAAVEEIDRLSHESDGRITVVFRHFPIESIHPHAFAAAVAAECAGEQGRFRAYHDALLPRSPGSARADGPSSRRTPGCRRWPSSKRAWRRNASPTASAWTWRRRSGPA